VILPIWLWMACTPVRSDPPAGPDLPAPPSVVINEWMAANASVWQLADRSLPDWFELYNAGTSAVELGRVRVTDGSGGAWQGPAEERLEPGEHLVVVADDGDAPGHAPFQLSADDDTLTSWVDGVAQDTVAIHDWPEDVVSARTPDGGPWQATLWATPGEPNPATASPTIDPSAALFGSGQTLAFAIAVAPEDEAALDVKWGEGVPGTLTFEGVTLEVTVTLKGSGSFTHLDGKPPFKVDVNERVAGQRLRGLKAITLNNGLHDPTFAHEALSYALFAAAGLPAPRVGWASVTYNGADYGLYVHVETTDDLALARWFAEPGGMLLEGTQGGDLGQWELLELEEGALDEVFLADLASVLADPAAPDAMERLEARVDVDQFVTFAALEALILHWDGYQRPKNYRVYLDPADGRLKWLPHGVDWTWSFSNGIGYGAGEVFRFCLAQPDCRERYVEALNEVCDLADALDPASAYLALAAWLEPAILADPRDPHDDALRVQYQAATLENLRGRTAAIRAEIASGSW
jgi:hypothetical protein